MAYDRGESLQIAKEVAATLDESGVAPPPQTMDALSPADAARQGVAEAVVTVAEGSRPAAPARIGRYLVLRLLGQGGMGTVYSAYDAELDRKVASKVVRDTLQQGSTGRTRVLQEAQAMARVAHPNVVHVYEVG